MAQVETGYRAFFLDDSGHITSAAEIAAPDDETALAQIQTLLNAGQRAELWQETRYVGVVQEGSIQRQADQVKVADAISRSARASDQY